MTTRKHVLVHGRVQGVNYRASAQERARRDGLRGWVRNRLDGRTVEVLVEGDDAAVAAFVRWCEDGPQLADVSRVEVDDAAEDANEPLEAFGIRPTV